MRRGRFFILIGVLLAVMAIGLLLVMSRQGQGGDEGEGTPVSELPLDESATPLPTFTPIPPTPIPNPVIVAKQNIPRGTLLVSGTIPLSDWLSVESWPANWITQEALNSFDQVAGKIARMDIPRGTLLTASMLTDVAGDLAAVGSDAALLIPPDRVGIAIPVDHISSVGWALRRGDHVDILVSFLIVNLDEEFQTELPNEAKPIGIIPEDQVPVQGALGRFEQDPFGQPINVVPSEPQRPRLVSQITVRDAEVLNLGPWGELFREVVETTLPAQPTPEGGEEEPTPTPEPAEGEEAVPQVEVFVGEKQLTEDEILRKYLTASTLQPLLLSVSPQDALVLKWSIEQGAALHVVLRSYSDAGVRLPDTETVSLQYMVDRFNIAVPPGLEYGVEPRLELPITVRQLQRMFLELPDDKLWPTQQTGVTEEAPPE